MAETDRPIPTRPLCHSCRRRMFFDYLVPDDLWESVVPHWLRSGYVCITCFAMLGDERRIDWSIGLKLLPLPFAKQIEIQERVAAGDYPTGGRRLWWEPPLAERLDRAGVWPLVNIAVDAATAGNPLLMEALPNDDLREAFTVGLLAALGGTADG